MALPADQLEFDALVKRIQPYIDGGLPQSAAFLSWFLENYYRLEDVAARDCICDKPNDKGVDGIFVDDVSEDIYVLQTKLRQKDNAKGERDLKDLVATLTQFESSESVDALEEGTASPELKRLLRDQRVARKVEAGYDVRGVLVTNVELDVNAKEFWAHNPELDVYNKARLSQEFVDANQPEGVNDEFTFSADDGYLEYSAGGQAKMSLFLARATELVKLSGISDQSLFSLNVRLSLGNTSVNKGIHASIIDGSQHSRFPLFHNGITLLAEKVDLGDEQIKVKRYVVVNGAQSLTALFNASQHITSDLRVLLRVVEVGADLELAKQITTISNNQNAIKPRDLRSNNLIQTRLKGEFEAKFAGAFYFVIKQGEQKQAGQRIENDDAGRWLMAFDLQQPFNAHQIYRVFDDDYSRIFGRPQVTAERIIFLHELATAVAEALADLKDKKVASYRLTHYFMLYCLRKVLELSEFGNRLIENPAKYLLGDQWEAVKKQVSEILVGLISDFEDDLEESGDDFDYKAELKSPVRVPELARSLVRSYQRDLKRGRIDDLDKLLGN